MQTLSSHFSAVESLHCAPPDISLQLPLGSALIQFLMVQRDEGLNEPLFPTFLQVRGAPPLNSIKQALDACQFRMNILSSPSLPYALCAALAAAKGSPRKFVPVCLPENYKREEILPTLSQAIEKEIPLLLVGKWDEELILEGSHPLVFRFRGAQELLQQAPKAIQALLDPLLKGPLILALDENKAGVEEEYPIAFFSPNGHVQQRSP